MNYELAVRYDPSDIASYRGPARIVDHPSRVLRPGDTVTVMYDGIPGDSYTVVPGKCRYCCMYDDSTCIRWETSRGALRCILAYRNRRAFDTLMFIRTGQAMEEL